MNKKIETISSETLNQMRAIPLAGEHSIFANVIERAVILSAGPVLNVPLGEIQSRPSSQRRQPRRGNEQSAWARRVPIRTFSKKPNETYLERIGADESNVAGPNGAATRLGMKRSTLQFRMRKLWALPRKRPTCLVISIL